MEYTKTYGIETIINQIKNNTYSSFSYLIKGEDKDFYVEKQNNSKYIRPFLSVVSDYSTSDIDDAKVILIEAVGASGKTALTHFLSYSLQCPVFDLGTTKVVAGNSLTGMLLKRMQRHDCSDFMDNISSGKSTLIIDALDEGYMKTNAQGYLDFLDDVISLEPKSPCPVIMLGRYNAVELAASFLVEREVDFVTLQIEPFTISSARDFIDKAVENIASIRYQQVYKQTRDYLLEKIGGFFKDQGSINDQASVRFIGYAPVLQSIAAFFDENTNYQVVLDELKSAQTQSVSLIIDILERILKRDRYEKVFPVLESQYLIGRDSEFVNFVKRTAYSNDEQCARVLYYVLGRPFPDIAINDASFLAKYNEGMRSWAVEHPFMGKHAIGNVVFESYILARLVKNESYQDTAFEYMRQKGVSYMFAYIYNSLYGLKSIDKKLLPFIYYSLRELNNKQRYYCMELSDNPSQTKNGNIYCDVIFKGSDPMMETFCGSVLYSSSDELDFGKNLEYLDINVPLDFRLSTKKVEASAPSYIRCHNLIIQSEEITVYNSASKESFMFECDDFMVDQQYDQYLQIVGPGKKNDGFKLICPKQPDYPLFEYWTSEVKQLVGLSTETMAKYKKLRTIILEFCSHSKHELAKHHERIDYVHGLNPIGKAVIKALLDSEVMFLAGHLYKLDADKIPSVLGLSYDEVRNFKVNNTIVEFLDSIPI